MSALRRVGALLVLAGLLGACGSKADGDADAGPVGGLIPPVGGQAASGGASGGDDAAATFDRGFAADAAARADANAEPFVPEPIVEAFDPQVPAAISADIPGAPMQKPADCRAEFVSVVRGWVVASGGAPIADAKAQVCVHLASTGDLLCLRPGTSDAEGVFTVELPENARCITKVAMRVLLPESGRSTMYCPIDITGTVPVVRLTEPFVLFGTVPVVGLPPEAPEADARVITFDDGLEVDFTPEAYYSGGGEYSQLSGRHVPAAARGLCFLGQSPVPDGLYALYPEGSVTGSDFAVRFPNSTALPPGTVVDLFVLGGLDCRLADGTSVPEAEWFRYGAGRVSADGLRVVSDAGVGLPCLTWLGYRRESE
ncbi:MAG: hypothetical protein EXR76_19245 [Myxococcales bacterium]|nr:hypothetical protein [Myxococcales bacterium]